MIRCVCQRRQSASTAALPSERQQEVELFSKPPTGTTTHEPRSIDWSAFFVSNSRPMQDDVWQAVVQPDLALLRGELGRNRVQRVLLYPRLHNGLGFGVGFTLLFRLLTWHRHLASLN